VPDIGQAPNDDIGAVQAGSALGVEEEVDGVGTPRDVEMAVAICVVSVGVVSIGGLSVEERGGFLRHVAGGFSRHLTTDSSSEGWDSEGCDRL
jgi:hypothetical protein